MPPAAIALWVLCADPTAPFVSPEGRFSVLFPGPVREQLKTQASKAGPVEVHLFNSDTETMGFLVSYSDHGAEVSKALKPKDQLAAARDSVVGKAGKVIAQREVQQQGNPGLEFKFQQDGLVATERAFLVGRRLYQVMALGPPGGSHDRAAQIFLDSFKLAKQAK